jgi:Na+-transporting NADH:ubiquinone oxidoreductase subunit C
LNRHLKTGLLVFLLGCSGVRADQYLTEEQALALALEKPKAARRMELPNEEPAAVDTLKAFVGDLKGGGKGVVFLDAVIGKHDAIDYMVVVSSGGEVRRIEILEYREAYGGQVRGAHWRKQFIGKKPSAPPEHGENIQNIAGATLSCKHVTEGVAKILKIFEERKSEMLGKTP